jgi:hypothetical protein
VAFFFVRKWQSDPSWGVGTGKISGKSGDVQTVSSTGSSSTNSTQTSTAKSPLVQIVENPTKFDNKSMTVRGRVRGATQLASNRFVYQLVDGDYKLTVFDDRKPPESDWMQTVTGVVKTIRPPLGSSVFAYINTTRSGVHYNEPSWNDIKGFFTDKFDVMKKGIHEMTK